MPIFFVEGEAQPGGTAILRGQDARHLYRVLRLGPGDEIQVVDGSGAEHRARIEAASAARVVARILGEGRKENREPSIFITILQGLPKGDKMDEVVRRNTEIGASRFVPVITERSTARPSPDQAAKRVDRWRRIAREAAKQAGRQRIPEVLDVMDLSGALRFVASEIAGAPSGLFLLPWELERSLGIREALRRHPGAKDVFCLVGPEGGFSLAEVRDAVAAGAIACSLGPRILRTETAALALSAIILYESGEMG